MNDIFEKALKAASPGTIRNKSAASLNWFRQYVKNNVRSKVTIQSLASNKTVSKTNMFRMGHMYIFAYDALHKGTLPYWDASPLVIPIHDNGTTITGINFHYLPLKYRAKLMNALYTFLSNDKLDSKTKLKMTYSVLKASSKFKYVKPCVKKYLKSHVRSQLIEIPFQYWEVALFLPMASWQNAKANEVFNDSQKIIGKG